MYHRPSQLSGEETLPAPPFVVHRVGTRRLLVAGGGGSARVGVPNFLESRILVADYDGKGCTTPLRGRSLEFIGSLSFKVPVVSSVEPQDAVMTADVMRDFRGECRHLVGLFSWRICQVVAGVDRQLIVWSTSSGVLSARGKPTFSLCAEVALAESSIAAVCFVQKHCQHDQILVRCGRLAVL